ncbi:hypothetical protein ACH5RR_013257 [Cinchona calisaya]|uniref:Uncharacterized protein n=1 Tax=Cinchona calisaya TaxID=153742 RepID=A0ABD2ZZI1_9GENT
METKAPKKIVVAKPIASRPTCSSFRSFIELLATAIRPRTLMFKRAVNHSLVGMASSQDLKADRKFNVVYKSMTKLVSKTTLSLLENVGTKVQALIFETDIPFFHQYFEPYKRHYISNAKVKYSDPNYATCHNECFWTIDNSTIVEQVNEQVPPEFPPIFQFTPFSKFFDHMEPYAYIDALGIVVHALRSTPVNGNNGPTTARDIVIINEE